MLEKNLEEIGLNEKEAKIYLASLELGQSVVQDIAKKASVNRATTYFVIENLTKMGLISSFHKNKKQYFIAADPDRLIEIINQEKNELEKRAKDLKQLMPQLRSINNKKKDRPVVRYYEGKEGIVAMVDEFLNTKNITINMAYSVDNVYAVFSEEEQKKWREKRITKGIKTKVIYTNTKGKLGFEVPSSMHRKVPLNKFPITCDISIYNDKVRLASLKDKLSGIIIEDKEIAKSLKAVLDLAWEAAEKYDKGDITK